MTSRRIIRNFFSNSNLWNQVTKSDLAKLRKKTGYTYANCKKALEINNDFESAEKWLKEQAQALGWSKAEKLQGRSTVQGLIGVATKGNTAIMVEINCETDFVGRNKKFKSLVELVTETCLQHLSKEKDAIGISKFVIGSEEIKSFMGLNGKTLSDHCALAISDLGENLNLRRALCVKSSTDIHLATFAHPCEDRSSKFLMGKYGAVVAYKTDINDVEAQENARQLCQHVVGMNPKKVGIVGEDEPAHIKDDEEIMIYQDFLLDPEVSVAQFMSNTNLKVVDFARIECGESLENNEDSVKLRASG